MSSQRDRSTQHVRLDRIRAVVELIGVATLTVTQLASAATALTSAARRRRTSCR